MAKSDPLLSKIRQICLALPETKETMTWGKPHFRVGDKIFAGYSNENGKTAIGFKLEAAHAETILVDARFSREQAVGYKGWISMDVGVLTNWEEVRPLIHESYRLIAPKAKPPAAAEKVVAKKAAPESAKPKAVLSRTIAAKAGSAKGVSTKSVGSKSGTSKATTAKATSKTSSSARPTSVKKTAVKKSR